MKYQKYPAQTIKVAGELRRVPATFENPEDKPTFDKGSCTSQKTCMLEC